MLVDTRYTFLSMLLDDLDGGRLDHVLMAPNGSARGRKFDRARALSRHADGRSSPGKVLNLNTF